MNILHVYKTYFPDTQGGLEEVIRQIAAGTTLKGINNRIFTLSKSPSPESLILDGVEVYRAKEHINIGSCGVTFNKFKEFKKQAAWADIIHYHYPWPFGDLLHLMCNPDKPVIVTYHSDIIRQKKLKLLYSPLMHAFLKRVNTIVATSENYAHSSKVLSLYADKVKVIPIGINDAYQEYDDSVLERYNLQHKQYYFFIGVLRYYKGLHVLLEAARNTDIQIVLSGDGPEYNKLKKNIDDQGITNVKMTGKIADEDKYSLLYHARAFVFPSNERSEAFGVSLVEAAMYGVPMISTELGTGTSYVNKDGVTGFVIKKNDPHALREAMRTMQEDGTMLADMSAQARRRYAKYFTAEKMVDAYIGIYKYLVN